MSFDISWVKITDQNRAALTTSVNDMYNEEGCGICRKSGAEVFWRSPISRCAHKVCFDKIKTAEDKMCQFIDQLYQDINKERKRNEKINTAHEVAIDAVLKRIQPDTLLEYLEKNGGSKLTDVFNSAGVLAVMKLHNGHKKS